MDKRIMVVLPYVSKKAQGKELELALKLWRKFCQFDYHFIVIGEFDNNLKEQFPWVEFIYCPMKNLVSEQYNPHLDIQHKMEYVMNQYSDKYSGFIWMVDDNYAIKNFELSDITTIHYHAQDFMGAEKSPKTYWNHDKWKTKMLLNKEGLPSINYTTHYPCWFDFIRLKEIWDKFNMREESYVLEDVYFNYFTHEAPILDSNIRLGIWNREIYKNDFKKALKNTNIKFVCNSVDGWSKSLENSLEIIATGDLKDIEKQIDIDPNFGFEYHLVDSCNLNCAGCSHYSSLFDKLTYPTLEKIIEDLSLIKNKIGDNIRWIRLLGGEPLLHPDLNNCLKEIRNLFPDIDLYIVTNGILLKNMNPEFYEICSRAKIKIMVTYYGLTNLNEIVHDIKMKGVDIDWYSRIRLNSWHYQHIRMTGERIDCLERCRYKNTCNNYKDGKLYLCPHIAYIDDFNRYFGKDIKLDESDYVSIDEINSFSELIDKLNNAKPNFCYQYCNYYDYNHPITGKWKRTEKDINEFCLI